MDDRLARFSLIAIVIIFLAACGRATPPLSTPAPDPRNQAFRAADVTIDSGAVTLAGTLLMPLEEKPVPAVIIIPGSGAATHNGSWNMFRSIGEYLVQRDLAVLLYDKRGVGDSTGNWKSETFDERVQDVAAMVTYLQSLAEIDPHRIGLIGHGQGAFIAPLVVAKYSGDKKFVPGFLEMIGDWIAIQVFDHPSSCEY